MKTKGKIAMPGKKEISFSIHAVFCILAAIIIYISANTYAKNITTNDDEEIATATVFLVLGGIYAGRALARLWISDKKNSPWWILVLLPLVITACIFVSVFFAGSLLAHQNLMYTLFLAFPLLVLCIATGMFVKLVRERIKFQLHEARITAVNSQAELQLLQSQLSPHFLFNTLNNIYGISISQHEKVPDLLLKLSELLRYSVYESREKYVALKEELAYILNYISFEKMRLEDRLVLTLDIEEKIKDSADKIAPMLLIIFIENAFKHSRNTTSEKIFVDIAIKLWQNSILFTIKNSYSSDTPSLPFAEKSNGVGLENAKKRLELLYAGTYDLQISAKDEFYTVMLRLNLQ